MADNGIPPVVAADAAAAAATEAPAVDIKAEDIQADNAENIDSAQENKQGGREVKEEESLDVPTETKDEPVADVKEENKDEPASADAKEETKNEPAADVKKGEPKTEATGHKTWVQKFRSNVKFDATVLPESDDPVEMRKQVRFFSLFL